MNIVITGFMGTGKTTVGRKLARKRGLRFLDTDCLIEEQTGMAIKDIFASKGEPYFREAEKEAIKKVTGTLDNVVLSTGGGAVVDAEVRRALKSWGVVVCLTASADAILSRLGDGDERPLIKGADKKEAVSRLLKARESAYKDCHLTLDTTDKSADQAAEEINGFIADKE